MYNLYNPMFVIIVNYVYRHIYKYIYIYIYIGMFSYVILFISCVCSKSLSNSLPNRWTGFEDSAPAMRWQRRQSPAIAAPSDQACSPLAVSSNCLF